MNNTNVLFSGDNKGWASYMLEKHFNPNHGLPFERQVHQHRPGLRWYHVHLQRQVRALHRFLSCPDTDGDMLESTQIIGDKQYEFALGLLSGPQEEVTGPSFLCAHDHVQRHPCRWQLQDSLQAHHGVRTVYRMRATP